LDSPLCWWVRALVYWVCFDETSRISVEDCADESGEM